MLPPSPRQLLSELVGHDSRPEDLSDDARVAAIAELNQRLADVAFELDAWPATFGALTRISLASGSALALIGFLTAFDAETPTVFALALRVAVAALAGLAGAAAVLIVGRSAKVLARQIRGEWDSSSRDIGKALGTSLAAVPKSRGIPANRFPR